MSKFYDETQPLRAFVKKQTTWILHVNATTSPQKTNTLQAHSSTSKNVYCLSKGYAHLKKQNKASVCGKKWYAIPSGRNAATLGFQVGKNNRVAAFLKIHLLAFWEISSGRAVTQWFFKREKITKLRGGGVSLGLLGLLGILC